MVDMEMVCSSCRTVITNLIGSTIFKCPSCGKADIVRCVHCREIGVRYKCPTCEFSGPN